MSGPIVNDGQASVDWAALLKDVTDAVKTDGTTLEKPLAVLDGDNVVITVRDNATGEVRTTTLGVPELDGVKDDADVAAFLDSVDAKIDEMIADLKDVARELERAAGAPAPQAGEDGDLGGINSAGVQKTLFDIYELIQLFQKLGQSQRDAARRIRHSELDLQAKSIQNQAEHQRNAAVFGAIVSAVMCVVQVAMLSASAFKAAQAQVAANKTAANQNLNASQQDLSLLDAGAKDKMVAQQNVKKMGEKLDSKVKVEIDSRFEAEVGGAETRLKTAEDAHAKCSADLKGVQDELGAIDRKMAELGPKTDVNLPGDQGGPLVSDDTIRERIGVIDGEVKTLDAKIANPDTPSAEKQQAIADKGRLETEKETLSTALEARKECAALNLRKQQLLPQEASLKQRLVGCETELKDARAAYDTAVDSFMLDYDAKFKVASRKAGAAEIEAAESGGTFGDKKLEGAKTAAQNEAAQSAKARAYVRARTIESKVKTGSTESLLADKEKALAAYDRSDQTLVNDRGYKSAMAGSRKWEMLSQMVTMLNGLFQSFSQLASTSEEVQATREQAEQKKQEQYRDETNQLFQQAQSVIDNARQLFQAVVQAESETMQQIIRV